jgi:hypothetical protein
MVNSTMPSIVKIGYTDRDVNQRAAELSAVTGVPIPFEVAFTKECLNPQRAESEIHSALSHCRLNDGREFFRIDTYMAIQTAEEICRRYVMTKPLSVKMLKKGRDSEEKLASEERKAWEAEKDERERQRVELSKHFQNMRF